MYGYMVFGSREFSLDAFAKKVLLSLACHARYDLSY